MAKLSRPWRGSFTTSIHKRQEISGVNLILFLDVEEKGQSKDTNKKKKARASLAPTWCRRTRQVETKENKTLSELLPLSRRT